MRALTYLGAAVAALALAVPTASAPTEGAIQWQENWEDAAKAAKAKGSVVFVYVHRINPP